MQTPDQRLAAAFGALLVMVALLPRPASASVNQIEIQEIRAQGDRIEFEVVTPGGPLLTSDRFEVTVNDLPVEDLTVTPSTSAPAPLRVVLVVDTSGSMAGAPIRDAKRAVARFAESLSTSDDLGLVGFSDQPTVHAAPGPDRGAVLRAKKDLLPSGETAIYDAVIQASRLLKSALPGQGYIVLLTDGTDTISSAPLSAAIATARRLGVSAFTVGLSSPDYSPGPLRELARRTGGGFLQAADSSELAALFEGLATTLVSRYQVAITNPDPGAKLLDIEVIADNLGTQLTGSISFEPPPQTSSGGTGLLDVGTLPREVVLLIIFLATGAMAFWGLESTRTRRRSPGQRLAWYRSQPDSVPDDAALIDAAVLNRAKEAATAFAHRAGYLERIEREIELADLKWRAGEAIVASLGIAVAGFVFGLASGGWGVAAVLALVGVVGPAGYVRHRSSVRRKALYEQLSDVCVLMSGALRAGHSLQQAIAAVAADARPPASDEFSRTMAQVRLGASLDEALDDLAARVNLIDLDWIVLAVRIQREVGGNLSEILETLADTIRERERLRRQLRALTAEGRLSAWILGLLPFGMAGILLIKSPDYLAPLYQTTKGLVMIGASAFMLIIGIFWMRKIINIEV